jgi:predicted Zn-dependent peptidase
MCKNERFSVNPLGNKNSVLNLNPEIIYKTWKNLLKSAQIEITMISSSSPESAVSGFKKDFLNIKRENIINFKTEFIKSAEKIQEIEEKQDIKQAKLVMGFRAGVSVEDKKDFFASHLMTALFGGTAHSKLFLNVREKLSLCYYCSASYIRRKGLIMVQSGIEKENIQKAQKEILNQLEEIKQGSFTDQELNAAKMSLKNSFISLSDSLASLENFYTSQSFDKEKYSPELYAKEIEKVTGDQVIKAANAVSLDTVYSLVN